MREHRHRAEAGRECELEVFDQIMSSLHTPGTRHEHMQCHETPTAGCASADCMEPDPARTIASEDLVDQCSFAGAPGAVHQTARGIRRRRKPVRSRYRATVLANGASSTSQPLRPTSATTT